MDIDTIQSIKDWIMCAAGITLFPLMCGAAIGGFIQERPKTICQWLVFFLMIVGLASFLWASGLWYPLLTILLLPVLVWIYLTIVEVVYG